MNAQTKETQIVKDSHNAVVELKGKIINEDTNNDICFTTLKIPAKDAYSQPSDIQLRSSRSLGRIGDVVEVVGKLEGYSRKFKFNNNTQTGYNFITWVTVE